MWSLGTIKNSLVQEADLRQKGPERFWWREEALTLEVYCPNITLETQPNINPTPNGACMEGWTRKGERERSSILEIGKGEIKRDCTD